MKMKSELERKATRVQVRKFEMALEALEKRESSLPPRLQKAERDGLRSVLEELKAELEE